MKRIVRSLFTLSMLAGCFGFGSFYGAAQPAREQTFYGVLEIVPGIRLTPEFGNFGIYITSQGSLDRRLESVIRPDGTFSLRVRSQITGYKALAVMRGDLAPGWEERIVARAYFWTQETETYPNPGYPFLPGPVATLAQRNAERISRENAGIPYLHLPINTGVDLGTIVLTKPGSITGRITLIDSPAVEMADLVVAIPQFGLVTKPNPDGGYLLTGVPPGTWNARLLGPGLQETRETVRLTYVAAMNPSVGVNFTIRGRDVPAARQIDPSNLPPTALPGGAKTPEKRENQKTPGEIEKEKAIRELLDKIPKKP